MKMSKAELKSLVKECLLEVLAEGLGSRASSLSPQRNMSESRQASQRVDLGRQPRPQAARPTVHRAVPDAVATMQKIAPPHLAGIFADPNTIATATKLSSGEALVEGLASGKTGETQGMGLYEQVLDTVDDLSQVNEFEAGASGHWAQLAFAGPRSVENTGGDDI